MADDDDERTEQPERPYHAKRPHKKSRKGCKNCKVRKVKCDEATPQCRSCRLRNVECVYLDSRPAASQSPSQSHSQSRTKTSSEPRDALASSRAGSIVLRDGHMPSLDPISYSSPTSSSSSTSTSSPPTSIIVEPLYRPLADTDTLDMKLLWFYSTATYTSFTVKGKDLRPVEDVMKHTLVRHAFQTPFLMHSIFALAGLHLQTLGQSFSPSRTLSYKAKAFEGYRTAIEEAKPETFPALIANSLLLTALASQVFREPGCPELYIIDWMIVWKGIGLIFDLISISTLVDSGLGALFCRPAIDLDQSATAIPNNLLFMITSISQDDPDFEYVETYYVALKYLGALYLGLEKDGFGPVTDLRIITWFTFLPRPFVALCQKRRQRALVILGHYSAFLKILQDIWWMAGIGERSIRDVCNYLGSDYHALLDMPLAALDAHDRLSVARIIRQDPSWNPPLTLEELEARERDSRTRVWVDDEGQELLFVGRSVDGRDELAVKSPTSPNQLPVRNR